MAGKIRRRCLLQFGERDLAEIDPFHRPRVSDLRHDDQQQEREIHEGEKPGMGLKGAFSHDQCGGRWIDGVGGIDGLNAPADMTPSRDGRYLFTTSLLGDAIGVFARDASSGEVAFAQVERDGVLGVGGLDRASAVEVSPDGRHVFVTATDDDALTIFVPEPGGMGAGSITVITVLWLAVRYRRRSGPD